MKGETSVTMRISGDEGCVRLTFPIHPAATPEVTSVMPSMMEEKRRSSTTQGCLRTNSRLSAHALAA